MNSPQEQRQEPIALALAADRSRSVSRPLSRKSMRIVPSRLAIHLLLIPGAITMIVPLLWMLSTSLKDPSSIFVYPPKLFPDPVVFRNYPSALSKLPFARAYFNSLYIATLVTLGNLVTCSLAGYAFARLNFKGRNLLFGLILAS